MNYDGSIFDDFDSAEGVGGDTNTYPLTCQETAVIRPGPLKLQGKTRRLFHHNQFDMDKQGATEYKEACSNLLDQTFTLLECYAAYVGSCLPTFWDIPLVSSSRNC